MTKALLLSGGMDSIAIAFWKRPDYAITIDYGQNAAPGEIRASKAVCKALGIQHEIVSVDCSSLGTGDMAQQEALEIAPAPEWWPYRNQLLVTLAAMRLIQKKVTTLYLGCLISDGFHKDSTKDFIERLSAVMKYQEGEICIEAPAINMTAAELIRESGIPLNIIAWAHSCHTGEYACGVCRGCTKHYLTMQELGYEAY